MSFRPHPAPTFRRSPPDANAVRRLWRDLADDARTLARGAGGEAWVEPLEIRARLAMASRTSAAGGQAMNQHVEDSLRSLLQAFLVAGTADRRERLAPALNILAGLVDAGLEDAVADQLALSRRIAGEPSEED